MIRDEIKRNNVLIVGGAGFIGSHLADKVIAEKANEVIIIDNLFIGSEKNIKNAISNGAVFYKEDAEFSSSLEYIFKKHNIDIVFNCATKALNYSFLNPKNAFDTNVNVILNLLELQRDKKFKTLCHFSTSEVYGTAVYEPMDEIHPKNPTTAYAAGKAAADLAIETYVRMFGLDAFIVRPFNNYGPRQNYIGALTGVIPGTVKKIFDGQSPEIHGTGQQSRDFIYVKDTVDAIIKLYPLLKSGESLNISTNGQITIEELINEICMLMDYNGEIIREKPRGSDVFCHNASNERLNEILKIKFTPFTVGLKETVNWYLSEFRGYND